MTLLLLGAPAAAWAAGVSGTVLQEGFEVGAPGWQFDGAWHIQDHPETISVASSINPSLVTLPDSGRLPAAFAGSHAAWFGEPSTGTFCGADFGSVGQTPKEGCTSSAPFSGHAVSPAFDLSGATSAQVDFESWWEIESVNADHYDIMSLEFSIDGGTTWTPVASLNPSNNPAGQHDQSYSADGLEEPPAWHHYVADLSAAAGHASVMLRFSFSTNDQLYNGFRGWLLDSIAVAAPYNQAPPSIASLSPSCLSANASPLVSIYGFNFVLGSRVLVDGSQVSGATPSDQRLEFVAPTASGSHTVEVVSPNGASSNTITLDVGGSCPAPPARYVALGDSYSSGEGVPAFAGGTDTNSDKCHRSNAAYAPLLVQRHAGGVIPSTVEFWACSGAVTHDFSSSDGNFHESPQLGRLEPGNATLVTFSVGGNDIGFADIGAACLKVNATAFKQLNDKYVDNCRNALDADTMTKIKNVDLGSLYSAIRRNAPRADVYVMGYPRLLPADPSSDCKAQAYREDGRKASANPFDQKATDGFIGIESRIGKDDVIWLNKVIDRLNGRVSSEAAAAGFHYVDVADAFAGHDVCSNNTDLTDRPWAHGLTLFSNTNDSPPNPSPFTFHPNADGQSVMSDSLFQAIGGGSHVTIQPGQTLSIPALVAAGQALLNIITHWPGSDVVTSLVSPSGQVFDRSTPGISHFVTATSENYVISKPEPGTWTVRVFGARVDPAGEDVRVDRATTPLAALAPVAVASATPDRGVAPVTIKLDGTGSSGVGAALASYVWDFGDQSPAGSGPAVSHTYTAAGTYQARLTVTDAAGQSDTTTKTILVSTSDQPPTVSLAVGSDPANDAHIYYDATGSDDVDGHVVAYSWDFGDGSQSAQGSGLHAYSANGTYTVRVVVTDDGGRTATATRTVTVTRAGTPTSPPPTSNPVAPVVSGFGVTNNPFVVGPARTPTVGSAKARHKSGTTFNYTLSQAASVKIVIVHSLGGRRSGGHCVAPGKKRHGGGARCTRAITDGTLARTSHQGLNAVPFSGRIGSSALKPGTYRATLTASNAARQTSKPATITFRVVKR